MALPQFTSVEHIFQQSPVIPEIVGDPPHVGVGFVVPCFVDQGRSGRQGENDWSSAGPDRAGEHFYLMLSGEGIVRIQVGIADVIAFDKIDAPGRVKLQKRIVVSLSFRRAAYTVHIRIPPADGTWVGDLICGYIRPFDRRVQMGGNPRDAPHDMDAEFQSQAVDVFGQRREAFSAGGGREAFRIRQQTGIFVCFQCGKRNILELCSPGACAVGVPLNVNHDIFPAVFLQMRRHVLRIAAYLRFVDCGVVVIVAVPAHRRVFGKIVFVHNRFLL